MVLDDRRERLRTFLIRLRSKFEPADVGLPASDHRRASGLTQCEVAELAGVSEVWYRLFESGHNVKVSRQFLASLAAALRMDESQRVKLYHLAIEELYRADEFTPSSDVAALVAPIGSPSRIDAWVKTCSAAREQFLTSRDGEHVTIRPRVLNSWRRSHQNRVHPDKRDNVVVASSAQLRDKRTANAALVDAANTIVSQLSTQLGGDAYAVILTDAEGTILDLEADRHLRRRLAKVGIETGTHMGEEYLGTNGIGTAIADARPLFIVGPEHFREPWHDLMCNGAPIRDPITGRIAGVLDATADYHLARPGLMGTMLQYAYAIEERLAMNSA